MRKIPLTQNQVALVDDEDYEWLNSFGKWQAHKSRNTYYAVKALTGRKRLNMHRMIAEKHFGYNNLQIDHKDNNGLNNQKSNLRYATQNQNSANALKVAKKTATSKYKGVGWYSLTSRWSASIGYGNSRKRIGYFKKERQAAIAYDIYAKKFFGKFAKLNVPEASNHEIQAVMKILADPNKRHGKSKYLGVCFIRGKWNCRIGFQGKRIYVGDFNSEKEAALAYNKKAIELFGEKATLNLVID